MKKIFLDANVVLDLLDAVRPEHHASRRVIEKIIRNGHRAVVTEDILTTVYYIVKDKQRALKFFEFAVTHWDVVPFGKKLILEAVAFCREDTGLDFEDVIQSLAAKQAECSILVTNDRNFYFCGVSLVSSVQALSKIEAL